MLNINQNFDLKAPVFNFDRDYFNSVEELNAYDTSNVPDHFVTNVAGMLYLFTNGKWRSIISTKPIIDEDINGYEVLLGSNLIKVSYSAEGSELVDPNLAEAVSLSITGDRKHAYMSSDTISVSKSSTHGSAWAKLNSDPKLELFNARDKITASFDYGNLKFPCIRLRHDADDMVTRVTPYEIVIGDEFSTRAEYGQQDVLLFYNNEYAVGMDAQNYRLRIGGTTFAPRFAITAKDTTKGATITGVESIAAFANPSSTKVWATDGSTVDLTTKANVADLDAKANTSDVLLKKNSRGGYYIGDSNDYVGYNAFSIGGNTANGSNSFAEGYDTKAYGSYSHVEGLYTEAHGESAHAEGDFTYAKGNGSHSEGRYARAIGSSSHAEGDSTYADGFAAHALGTFNVSNKNAIHSVGIGDRTTNKNAEYIYAKNNTDNTLIVDDPKNGYKYLIGIGGYDGISTDNSNYKSILEVITDINSDLSTKANTSDLATKANTSDVLLKKSASGGYYIEENSNSLGDKAFAATKYCTASGSYSFAEGASTKATGDTSHAEGAYANAIGYASHAEGSYTVASGPSSHAEGEHSNATGEGAHAEGYQTLAKNMAAHAEGMNTKSVGYCSHVEGSDTEASGFCAHALGAYNIADKNAIHSVGIGNSTTRKNAEYIYAKSSKNSNYLVDDPKNGYKYLIGVGGYDGISTDNTTYKSVQEVIADLTARIEQLETKVRALEAANTPA